jgi:hypothetical protein
MQQYNKQRMQRIDKTRAIQSQKTTNQTATQEDGFQESQILSFSFSSTRSCLSNESQLSPNFLFYYPMTLYYPHRHHCRTDHLY